MSSLFGGKKFYDSIHCLYDTVISIFSSSLFGPKLYFNFQISFECHRSQLVSSPQSVKAKYFAKFDGRVPISDLTNVENVSI
jgi:hypothetical protein